MSLLEERRAALAVLSETLTGFQISGMDVAVAVQIGAIVTVSGYKLLWLDSLGWVVQLPLDFQETAAPTS